MISCLNGENYSWLGGHALQRGFGFVVWLQHPIPRAEGSDPSEGTEDQDQVL